ncbi:MAG: hypothetical protein Fur0011_3570 [Candidatus Microgenomates bacterium]
MGAGVLPIDKRLEEPDRTCSASVGEKLQWFVDALGCINGEWIAVADILATEPDGRICMTDREGEGQEKIISFANKMRKHHRKPLLIQNTLAIGEVGNLKENTMVTWRSALLTLSPALLKMLSESHALEQLLAEYPEIYKPRSLAAIHFPALALAAYDLSQENHAVWMKMQTPRQTLSVSKNSQPKELHRMLEMYMCGFPHIENGNIIGLVKYDKKDLI